MFRWRICVINLKTKDWQIDDIDTILFDKDGTFIDLHYFWGKMTELRADAVINRFNLEKKLFSKLCMFLGYDVQTCRMQKDGITALYSRPKIIELFCENLKECGINTTHKEIEKIFDNVNNIFYAEMSKYTKPIDSAIGFIKKVHSLGIKCGIVTSDSKESTMKTLKHFGWESFFEVVIGRESTQENKESGIPAKMAIELLNANLDSTIMVGDAPMDYLAAKNAGIEKTILVATGQLDLKTLFATSPFVVKDLSDVTVI